MAKGKKAAKKKSGERRQKHADGAVDPGAAGTETAGPDAAPMSGAGAGSHGTDRGSGAPRPPDPASSDVAGSDGADPAVAAPPAPAPRSAARTPAARGGTDSKALNRRRAAVLPRGLSPAATLWADRAAGAELRDASGRRFIDFAGGLGALAVGHAHPDVAAAAARQAEALVFSPAAVALHAPYLALAERLAALAPVPAPAKVVLLTTGAEAVETAVRIARVATGRPAVIAFEGASHGLTHMALGLGGMVAPAKPGAGPFPADIFRAPLPDLRAGLTVEQCIARIEGLMRTDVDPSRVAAILLEPVLGAGGHHPVAPEMWHALRGLADRHGILLIADEVQTGIGRTGRWFGVEHAGVAPDLIAVGRALGGGWPIAGVVGSADVMDAVPPGALGGTFGGHPVAAAAALATLDAIEAEGLLDRATAIGQRLRAALAAIAGRAAPYRIWDIRGMGAMIAVEVVRDFDTAAPDPDLAEAVRRGALDRGLILLRCGVDGNAIRFAVPLVAPDALIDEGLQVFEDALAAAVGEDGAAAP